MKKTVIILSIALTVSLFFHMLTPLKMLLSPSGHDITLKIACFIDNISRDELINNEETALEYGKLVIRTVYGEESKEQYIVSYNSFYKVWKVEGTLPKGVLGGGPTVILERNGRVISVTHTY